MGARQLRKIQLGHEATPGTAVAATTIWRGSGTIRDDRDIQFATEDVGILSDTDRSYTQKLEASLAMTPTECTFEQFPYILEAGIKAVGTGAADGAGSDKIYSYPISTTAQNTLKTKTIEGGDNSGAERMEYGLVMDFTLNGQVYKPLMMSANWIGRQSAANAFTGALTPILVDTPIMFGTGKLFIDAIGGTIGTTQVSGSLKSLNLKCITGVERVPSVENLYYTSHAIVNPKLTFDAVFYWDTNAIAEKANFRNEVSRLLQFKWEGPAVQTPGTTYSKKTAIINIPGGKWVKWSELQDDGGHNVVTASYEWRWNLTAVAAATFIVVNEVATLP